MALSILSSHARVVFIVVAVAVNDALGDAVSQRLFTELDECFDDLGSRCTPVLY